MKKVLGLLFITLLISGCNGEVKRKDIDNYLKDYIGISGYELSKDYTITKDNEGFNDKYYDVSYKDIFFKVVDDHYLEDRKVKSKIYSTFDTSVISYYYNKYDNKDAIKYEKSFVNGDDIFKCVVMNDLEEVNNSKLQACYDSLKEFISKIDFTSYPINNILLELTNDVNRYKRVLIYENGSLRSLEEIKKEIEEK